MAHFEMIASRLGIIPTITIMNIQQMEQNKRNQRSAETRPEYYRDEDGSIHLTGTMSFASWPSMGRRPTMRFTYNGGSGTIDF